MKPTNIFLLSILFSLSFLSGCGSDESAARIVLGDGNFILLPDGDLQYQKAFVVQVTDLDGVAVPNVSVTMSLRNVNYRKGTYSAVDVDTDGTADLWGIVPATITTCTLEDTNNNGVLDAGEDINGNGTLEPTNPASIIEHPSLTPTITGSTGKLVTDDNGFGYFVLAYPKSEAGWSTIDITATAEVLGTEENEIMRFTLSAASDDLTDLTVSPPGYASPYGTAAVCTDPN